MTFEQNLLKFIREDLIGEEHSIEIDENEHLIERGFIDSMGLMKLVAFIEEQSGISISDDDLIPENFETVASIVRMVQRLQS